MRIFKENPLLLFWLTILTAAVIYSFHFKRTLQKTN